ncbi:MAG: FadR family transcriptional regulator, partial [Phycisphaerae bacterium]|nr:FadR family transcriptional regulator [Phycisphaerae bacterium]
MKTTNQTLTEQTVELLRNRITSSGLSPGEPFATEAELAGEFKVSRPVLREAISRLRAVGLLESRQCVGLIVARPDPVALFEQAVQDWALDSIDLQQLGELRYALEIGAVELAVRRANVGQLSRLAELAEEFAKTLTEKSPARSTDRVELDFHQTILQATGNIMLMRMHRVITAFFARSAEENEAWNAHG